MKIRLIKKMVKSGKIDGYKNKKFRPKNYLEFKEV
jgi:hypothetical protein